MKKALQYVTLLAVVAGLAMACSKPKHARFIPKDATFVMAANLKSMALKTVNFSDLLNLDWLGKKDKSEPTGPQDRNQRIAAELKNSGIDLLNTVYLFSNAKEGESEGNMTAIIPLDDAAKFEKFLLVVDPKYTATQEGDLKFAGDNEMVIGWNSDHAFISSRKGSGTAALKKYIASVAATDKSNSLAEGNDSFGQFQKGSGDVSFWMDLTALGKNASALYPATASASGKLKDNYLIGNLNFNDGEVVMDGSVLYNNAEAQELTELFDRNVEGKLMNTIPAKDPVAVMAFRIDMDALKKLLAKEQSDKEINQNLVQMGTSLEDVYAAFDGNVVASVNSFSGNMPEVYFTMGVKDREALNKITGAFQSKNMLQASGNYFTVPASGSYNVSLLPGNDRLSFTNSDTLRDNLLANKTDELAGEARTELKDGSFYFYLDYQKMASLGAMLGAGNNPSLNVTSENIRSLIVRSSQKSAKESEFRFTLKMMDAKQNSLVTLMKMGQKMQQLEAKRQATIETQIMTEDIDSVTTNVDVDAALEQAAEIEAE